ncbi:7359_t:CDS:2, partial [Gigaspora rosea]
SDYVEHLENTLIDNLEERIELKMFDKSLENASRRYYYVEHLENTLIDNLEERIAELQNQLNVYQNNNNSFLNQDA